MIFNTTTDFPFIYSDVEATVVFSYIPYDPPNTSGSYDAAYEGEPEHVEVEQIFLNFPSGKSTEITPFLSPSDIKELETELLTVKEEWG